MKRWSALAVCFIELLTLAACQNKPPELTETQKKAKTFDGTFWKFVHRKQAELNGIKLVLRSVRTSSGGSPRQEQLELYFSPTHRYFSKANSLTLNNAINLKFSADDLDPGSSLDDFGKYLSFEEFDCSFPIAGVCT